MVQVKTKVFYIFKWTTPDKMTFKITIIGNTITSDSRHMANLIMLKHIGFQSFQSWQKFMSKIKMHLRF